jgi:hypothetical protein
MPMGSISLQAGAAAWDIDDSPSWTPRQATSPCSLPAPHTPSWPILCRYDRPWGPERPSFGKLRYMSSDNTRRKCRLEDYLQTYRPNCH